MAAATVRVLIADDHSLFVDALRALLETEPGIDVVATAPNGLQAVERVVELEPEVVLMDVSMPVLDGFEATRTIRERAPGTRVLFVTGSNAEEDLERAREVGASGYVSKDRIAAELVEAIRDAAPSTEQLRTPRTARYPESVLGVVAAFHVLVSIFMVVLVLMHSGRDAGFGGLGYTPASQGGQHIVERNLTRLTVAVAVVFTITTIALFYML